MGGLILAKEALLEHAKLAGFESIGEMDASSLAIREEVRSMCAADLCKSYNRSWSCPPACGSLSFFEKNINAKQVAVVFQTVAKLEDDFDFEGMLEAAQRHEQRFNSFAEAAVSDERVTKFDSTPFFLGAGGCTLCEKCSYPDEPCRHPERLFASMEAAGILVSDACAAARIPYNHGRHTVCYTSCVLIGERAAS